MAPGASCEGSFRRTILEMAQEAGDLRHREMRSLYDLGVTAGASQLLPAAQLAEVLGVVEANALLYGRYDVDYEDILAAQWGICLESDPAELVRFEAVAKPIIQEAKKKKGQNLDEVQIALIKEY